MFPPERENSRFSKPLDAVLAHSHKIPFGNFEFLLARIAKGCYRPCVGRDSTVERGAPDLFKRAGLIPGSFYFHVLIKICLSPIGGSHVSTAKKSPPISLENPQRAVACLPFSRHRLWRLNLSFQLAH